MLAEIVLQGLISSQPLICAIIVQSTAHPASMISLNPPQIVIAARVGQYLILISRDVNFCVHPLNTMIGVLTLAQTA
jgi:hypothetical protein